MGDVVVSLKTAKQILGADFLTPEELSKRGIGKYTQDQYQSLAWYPPSEEALVLCRDNGFAVVPNPPAPMSTLDVRGIEPRHFFTKTEAWYDGERFASEDKTGGGGWLMAKKEPVQSSMGLLHWDEMVLTLDPVERPPSCAEMAWFVMVYHDLRGIVLFKDAHARTSSVSSDGAHVGVGVSGGLKIGRHYGGFARHDVGIAAALDVSKLVAG